MLIRKAASYEHRTPRLFFYLGLLTIGQTVYRPALSFTLSDWFFFISLILTTSECLLRRNLKIKYPPMMIIGLFFFTMGGIISSSFADMPLISVFALIKYLYLIAVWFWLGTILLQTPAQIQTSIVLWISSAALSGLGAIMQLVWGDIIPGTAPAWDRMTGLTEHVNDLGGLTSIALIPAIMMLTRFPKSNWRFIFSWICITLIVGGLVLSVSMSGVVALSASLLAWIVFSGYSHKKVIITSIACLLFFIAVSVQSHYKKVSILSRLYNISADGFSSVTLQTRMDTYAAAWEVIKNNPLLGVGMGPDVGSTKTGYVVHNIFLLNWFETGFFGLLGILLIHCAITLYAYRGLMDPHMKQERVIGAALFSSYIAFLALGIAQPIYYKRFGWIPALLIIALYSSRNRSKFKRRQWTTSNKLCNFSNVFKSTKDENFHG